MSPLTLHPFTVADAERVLSGEVDPHDGWEGGYAFTDEPELLSAYVHTVLEALALARATGASSARAETEVGNLPARRALEKAGMAEATRVADIVTYEIRL